MSRSARKATARRIWLTARLILATRGAGQRALNSPRRRRIRERPGRGARQREDEQAEAHPYGLAHPAHQAERDCRRRSEAERGERDHIAALEGAEARRDQERSEADRGAERLDHGGRRQQIGTRLNSSHSQISYAVFCLKKKNHDREPMYPSFCCSHSHSAPLPATVTLSVA